MRTTWIAIAAAAALATAAPAGAETQTWFGFTVGVSSGAHAQRTMVWRSEPSVVWVGHVAVVDRDACDDDVFRCDRSWWRMSDGWWFRSSSWRGPWVAVDVRRVPRAVLDLPPRHWKHHPHGGPPGQMKKDRRGWDDDRDDGRGRGRGHQ